MKLKAKCDIYDMCDIKEGDELDVHSVNNGDLLLMGSNYFDYKDIIACNIKYLPFFIEIN